MVHGEYGPQNLLVDAATWEVSAVLDWEFAHDGDPLEDLARALADGGDLDFDASTEALIARAFQAGEE